jgi:hypothetical protein
MTREESLIVDVVDFVVAGTGVFWAAEVGAVGTFRKIEGEVSVLDLGKVRVISARTRLICRLRGF